jgi:hypothetical protein
LIGILISVTLSNVAIATFRYAVGGEEKDFLSDFVNLRVNFGSVLFRAIRVSNIDSQPVGVKGNKQLHANPHSAILPVIRFIYSKQMGTL